MHAYAQARRPPTPGNNASFLFRIEEIKSRLNFDTLQLVVVVNVRRLKGFGGNWSRLPCAPRWQYNMHEFV
ncbi:MAG TPA: hypothetical protein VE130_11370 [Nitrososphaeraceae archaeon]|nr:hypothetical protein [Nitrososphaeraceae archaeon]